MAEHLCSSEDCKITGMGHGRIYGLLYTAAVFPLELNTEVGLSSIAIRSLVSSVDNAGRNIGVVGQSGSLVAPPDQYKCLPFYIQHLLKSPPHPLVCSTDRGRCFTAAFDCAHKTRTHSQAGPINGACVSEIAFQLQSTPCFFPPSFKRLPVIIIVYI